MILTAHDPKMVQIKIEEETTPYIGVLEPITINLAAVTILPMGLNRQLKELFPVFPVYGHCSNSKISSACDFDKLDSVLQRYSTKIMHSKHFTKDQSDQKDVYTKMHVPKEKEEREKSLLFAKVQQIVCDKLKRRGVRTVTGLGQHYEKLCQKSSAPQHFLVKSDLEEGLKVFHIELPQT
ncbi:Hypothetical predicted protein, partial [Octopus vulgaris]